MRILIFLGLIMFLNPSVHAAPAYDGIFSILDEHYAENVSGLPESNDLKPEKSIQRYGNIEGWIDIVGFSRMVREEGTDYVPGDPADHAIVQNDARGVFKCSICRYSITKDLRKQTSGSNTIATLDMKMTWYEKVCGKDGCSCIEHIEYASFSDSERSPEIYPALTEPEVIMTQYNNSMYENAGIRILGDNYTKISFSHQDKQAVRSFKILHAEETQKGVVYGNVTELEQWKIEGAGISRFYNEILMDGNLSKMDLNEFDIRVYNPYTTMKADPKNFTIERVEFAPQKNMNGLLIAVVGMVSTFMIGTLYLFNRTVYRWNIKLF
jgi:hypothetical protein